MKTVLLASKQLVNYDRAADGDFLCGVTVSKQCYAALKASGYILGKEERKKLADAWNLQGCWRAHSYGGETGFTYKELMNFLGGSCLTAAQVRAL